MAQVSEKSKETAARTRLILGQRPGYALLAVAAAAAIIAAGAFGVASGWDSAGVVIETSEETAEDEADAGLDDAADADAVTDTEDAGTSSLDTVVVDVDGAVANPSVVELPAGSRVADAIDAAGGLTSDADISGINRAAVLTDGEKIYIPEEGEEVSTTSSSSSSSTSSSSSSDLVNINTADADELDTLPGVGPAIAQAIIDDREANGAFTSIEDIMRVSGIGEAKFANMKDLICV